MLDRNKLIKSKSSIISISSLQANEEAATTIVRLVRTVCLNNPPTEAPTVAAAIFETVESDDETRNPQLIALLACAIEVGQNVTEKNDLGTIWELYEPVLREHLRNLTNCADDEECFSSEITAANTTWFQFLGAVEEVSFSFNQSIRIEQLEIL